MSTRGSGRRSRSSGTGRRHRASPLTAEADRPGRRALVGDARVLGLLIAGGVMASVVVFVVGLSTATFSATTHNKDNSFAAGTADLSLSTPAGQPIVNTTNIALGQTRTGDVDVKNTGERATLSVEPTGTTAAPTLANALTLSIVEAGNDGSLGTPDDRTLTPPNTTLGSAGRVVLGTYHTGQVARLRFQIALPASAPPSLAGTSVGAALQWQALTVAS